MCQCFVLYLSFLPVCQHHPGIIESNNPPLRATRFPISTPLPRQYFLVNIKIVETKSAVPVGQIKVDSTLDLRILSCEIIRAAVYNYPSSSWCQAEALPRVMVIPSPSEVTCRTLQQIRNVRESVISVSVDVLNSTAGS